jgi:hypothetical protein
MDDGNALSHADHDINFGFAPVIACFRDQQQYALAALRCRIQ